MKRFTPAELKTIQETHDWIIVEKVEEPKAKMSKAAQTEVDKFVKHHVAETSFLIDGARKLAAELLFYKQYYENAKE